MVYYLVVVPKAVQIKLDELIRSINSARNEIIDVEDASEEELKKLQEDFAELVTKSQEKSIN